MSESQPTSSAAPIAGKKAKPWQRLLPFADYGSLLRLSLYPSQPRRCGRRKPAALPTF
jgi:hypothetical protein